MRSQVHEHVAVAKLLLGTSGALRGQAVTHVIAAWCALAGRRGADANELVGVATGGPLDDLADERRRRARATLETLFRFDAEGIDGDESNLPSARRIKALLRLFERLDERRARAADPSSWRRARMARWAHRGVVALIGLTVVATLVAYRWRGDAKLWRAEYFDSPNLVGEAVVTRAEFDLRFDWRYGRPSFSVPNDHFSARWTTCLHVSKDTDAVFMLVSQDGSRLFIGDRLVVDNLGEHPPRTRGARFSLAAGDHELRIEYFHSRGRASIAVLASFDGGPPDRIPASMLGYPRESLGNSCGSDP